MITKCPYCPYSYADEPLSTDIMKQVAASEHIAEDWLLWMDRLMQDNYKKHGLRSYRGVKIHVGRKHKNKHNYVLHEPNEVESNIINGVKAV